MHPDTARLPEDGHGAGDGCPVAAAATRVAGDALVRAAEKPAVPGLSFFEAVQQRRSVRKYKPAPIPDEQLTLILDAGRLAPTSGNQQPWRFLVVRDRARVERCREETIAIARESMAGSGQLKKDEIEKRLEGLKGYLAGILAAPVFVLVLVDSTSQYPSHNEKDGSLAAAHIQLAARALGYGSVFLTDGVPEEASKRAFAIPERFRRIAMIPIGLPDADTVGGWPVSPAKKALREIVAYETIA